MSSLLEQLEQEIADRLTSDPFFANIAVHVDPQKNIVAEITTKIAKTKTLVAPLVASADDLHPNLPGLYFERIQIQVGIFQNPILQGTDPSPREIAQKVHLLLKQWMPDGMSSTLEPGTPSIEAVPDNRLNIYNVNFLGKGGIIDALPQVGTVTIDVQADVTLACATAGAATYYTTDDSTPAPRNGTLYLAPFTAPASGTKIKARAFLAGYLASAIASTTIA